jgi:hypothetical protein
VGIEAYPCDPSLRLETQRGLDRLRCFADRALAADLYAGFEAAEHNTEAELEQRHERERRLKASRNSVRLAGERALNGELGHDAKELAEHLLLDQNGQRLAGELPLDEFARALAKLRRLQRTSR